MDPPVRDVTFFAPKEVGWGPLSVTSLGFYGFQGSRLIFMVPGWFFMVLGLCLWFFMVSGWFFIVSGWLHGFSWFQVGFHGFSCFQVGVSWFQVGF